MMIKRVLFKKRITGWLIVVFLLSTSACRWGTMNSDSNAKPTAIPFPIEEPSSGQPAVPLQPRSVTPEELVPYISWGAWGGAGNAHAPSTGIPTVEFLFDHGSESMPSVHSYDANNPIMLGELFVAWGNNYPPGEPILVTFVFPDDTQEKFLTHASVYGILRFERGIYPSQPTGLYRVSVQSDTAVFLQEFVVVPASKPIFAVSCGNSKTSTLGHFSGFAPLEEILIARYAHNDHGGMENNLLDYWYIQTDENGNSLIELPKVNTLVTAMGIQRLNEIGGMKVSAYDFVWCRE